MEKKIQTFEVEKFTKTVAICNCPVGANINEVDACRQMFKEAMRDMHIDWDTVEQRTIRDDNGAFVVFKATKTSLKLVVC